MKGKKQNQKQKQILVVGGDQRERYLLKGLLNDLTGWEVAVSAYALPKKSLPEGVNYCKKAEKALSQADVIILPMPGIAEDGKVYAPLSEEEIFLTKEQWGLVSAEALVLVGAAGEMLKAVAAEYGLELVETADLDEIAIPNAIPTAEGAIKIAIEETPFTIDGAEVVILGYGRVGEALAKKIRALDGKVTVVNRGKKRQAQAAVDGFCVNGWSKLSEAVAKSDIVYNTIPELVLTGKVMGRMKETACIIDLAANPGGTDFSAAAKEGIKAILASGLPGKVAPQFAGEVLAKVYPEIIAQYFTEQENRAEDGKAKIKAKKKEEPPRGKREKSVALEQTEERTEEHKVRIRKKAVAASTTKINGKVRKAQKQIDLVEQSGAEKKKTAGKSKKKQQTKAIHTGV